MPTDSWDQVKTELEDMSKNPEYLSFLPLLEHLNTISNARRSKPDIINGLIYIIKKLQLEARKGGNFRELFEQTALGFIQPEWNVQGIVNQANRDIYVNTIIQVFSNTRDKLDLNLGIPIPLCY